jgi:hypothetical protein
MKKDTKKRFFATLAGIGLILFALMLSSADLFKGKFSGGMIEPDGLAGSIISGETSEPPPSYMPSLASVGQITLHPDDLEIPVATMFDITLYSNYETTGIETNWRALDPSPDFSQVLFSKDDIVELDILDEIKGGHYFLASAFPGQAFDAIDTYSGYGRIGESGGESDKGQIDIDGNPASGPDPAPVPEPESILLLGSGLIALAGWGRKKTRK